MIISYNFHNHTLWHVITSLVCILTHGILCDFIPYCFMGFLYAPSSPPNLVWGPASFLPVVGKRWQMVLALVLVYAKLTLYLHANFLGGHRKIPECGWRGRNNTYIVYYLCVIFPKHTHIYIYMYNVQRSKPMLPARPHKKTRNAARGRPGSPSGRRHASLSWGYDIINVCQTTFFWWILIDLTII